MVTVTQGGSFDVAMDFEDDGYDGHYGNIYVDWDADGSWSSSDETQIMENVNDDTVTYSATVDVPSDAATGGTLARVRLSWGSFYGPTATDEYGEVNDFTVYVESSSSESAPAVDSLSASEVETSDGDAEFDVDWSVSDADGDLSSVDLTLTDDTAGETEDTASISVSGDTASGTTRLVAAGDDESGNSYTVDCTVTDANGNTASDATSITESEPNSAPTVDSLSASEVETSDSDAEFDVSWDVGDSDGNLSTVDLTLTDETDGETEDSASISVSGSDATGTTRLVAAGDDGSGNSYTVDCTVTDSDGATASDSTSVSETEDTTGDNAPAIDSYTVTEAGSPNPHAEITADWSVSDADGDLSTVDVEVYDSTGALVDSSTTSVSGSSASGSDSFKIKHADGETFDVTLTVTDAAGNSTSETQTVTE